MWPVGSLRRMVKPLQRARYRRRVLRTAASCGPELKVNGLTIVNRQTQLGRNVNFNGLEVAGRGKVVIGDNFHSGPGCLLITQMHNYDTGKAIPYDDTYVLNEIAIGDNVWLGSRVIILGNVTIGEGAIIQAGSCVVTDIPMCAIAGGHPAKVFKYRDVDHYEALKATGQFH